MITSIYIIVSKVEKINSYILILELTVSFQCRFDSAVVVISSRNRGDAMWKRNDKKSLSKFTNEKFTITKVS